MKKSSLRSSLLLFLTAAIWGVAFVAQSVGMDYVGPFTFSCTRCLLGGIVLLPFIWFTDRHKKDSPASDSGAKKGTVLWTGGICCGFALFVASNLQQVGMQYTSVGKAGFITAMYIVIVPLLGFFLGRKLKARVGISVLLAVAGLYLLCITEDFSLGRGDFLVLLCAFVFAIHILVIDHFSPLVDGVRMSCIQFFVCGLLSGIVMLICEHPSIRAIAAAWLPIGYAGILSCGVAYTLQIVGQRDMDPTVASLILCLESVVSVLAGWALLGQTLSAREGIGCVLMFAAIILAQLSTA